MSIEKAAEVRKTMRDVDASIKTVRAFISGKASIAALGAALDGLDAGEMDLVSFAVRVPLLKLQALRKAAGAQAKLFAS